MLIEIRKWRNGGAVRLPAAVMKQAKVRLGDRLDVQVEDGKIVLMRTRPKYRLEDLIAGFTEEGRHEEVDFGPPVGREIL